MQEVQQRLVKLKRDVAAQRAQRARMNFYESKQEQAQVVRRQMDDLLGKDLLRDFIKIKAADEDEVIQLARSLNDQLLVQYNLDAAQRSRGWIRLWRETDVQGVGRVSYEEFTTMLRKLLPHLLRKKTSKGRGQVTANLKALWRYLDDDGAGDLKGYLVLSQFLAFVKLGIDEDDGSRRERAGESG